jgi:hypothetical protein
MAGGPPADDRTYLAFLATGMAVALAGGFVLAVVAPLSATGVLPYEERTPLLIQAHAWAQLLGFAGVIVAGMAFRLIPRFAGAPPPDRRLARLALLLLAGSAFGRIVFQPWVDGRAGEIGLLVAALAGAAGMAFVAASLWQVVSRGRKAAEPWRDFVRAGIAWWLVWAVLSTASGIKAAGNDRFVPLRLEDGAAWIAMLGVIGSFIWAVQGRSVSVFFGRQQPPRSRTMLPFVSFNGGLALIGLSLLMEEGTAAWRFEGVGIALAGAGLAVLPFLVGAVWGKARRLRPRARSASRYILAANIAGVGAGLLLVWAGIETVSDGAFAAFWARDAARHLVGLGLITMLIVGMAQLVAPVFALERATSRRGRIRDEAVFWLLVASLVTRAGAGLLAEVTSYDSRMNHSAYAGLMAWAALALFAWRLLAAVRAEPHTRAFLAGQATGGQEAAGSHSH